MFVKRLYRLVPAEKNPGLFYGMAGMLAEKDFDVRIFVEHGETECYLYASKNALSRADRLLEGERTFRLEKEPRGRFWELLNLEEMSRYGK